MMSRVRTGRWALAAVLIVIAFAGSVGLWLVGPLFVPPLHRVGQDGNGGEVRFAARAGE